MTNPRQRDAEVAEKVMGWIYIETPSKLLVLCPPEWKGRRLANYIKPGKPGDKYIANAPHFTTAPSDDYKVLEKVRGEWGLVALEKMYEILVGMWEKRSQTMASPGAWFDLDHLLYEPGDYSAASLQYIQEVTDETST